MTTRSGKKNDRDEDKNEISNDQKIDNVIILKYFISV